MKRYLPLAALIALAPAAALAQSSSTNPPGETNATVTPTTNDPTTGATEAPNPASNDPGSGATQAPDTGSRPYTASPDTPVGGSATTSGSTHGKRPHHTQP